MCGADWKQGVLPSTIAAVRLARSLSLLIFSAAVAVAGCNRAPPPAAQNAKAPAVASLVPAATDLILGMGAGDHLVAVSNYDQPRQETQSLPRVGDYRTIDWEKLAELKPAVMIVQFRADKMPAGLEERAAHYGIRLVNVRINRLEDIFTTMAQLGDAVGEKEKAQRAAADLRQQLDAVRARVAGRPRVRTYVAQSDDPLQAVGPANYMDELLTIAGGENVLSSGEAYPAIDREQLLSLKPDAVLNLLPGASPQALEKAKSFWAAAPSSPATRAGRVYYLTEDYLLWPGMSVGKVADRFAEKLHPETRGGTTTPSPASTLQNNRKEEPLRHRDTEAGTTFLNDISRITHSKTVSGKGMRSRSTPLCLCASVALPSRENREPIGRALPAVTTDWVRDSENERIGGRCPPYAEAA